MYSIFANWIVGEGYAFIPSSPQAHLVRLSDGAHAWFSTETYAFSAVALLDGYLYTLLFDNKDSVLARIKLASLPPMHPPD